MRVSTGSRVNGDPECRWCGRLECDGDQCFVEDQDAGAAQPPTCTMCKGALADDAQEGMCGRCHDKREQIRTGNY